MSKRHERLTGLQGKSVAASTWSRHTYVLYCSYPPIIQFIFSRKAAHSCAPSARPSFSSGTTELHLIANRNLKKGEVLTIAYVDVTQHAGETVADCRRRRRVELSQGWRFPCACPRCEEEGNGLTPEELKMNAGEVCEKDESKLEPSMSRLGSSADHDNVE